VDPVVARDKEIDRIPDNGGQEPRIRLRVATWGGHAEYVRYRRADWRRGLKSDVLVQELLSEVAAVGIAVPAKFIDRGGVDECLATCLSK
jgi:hypothetical protein